MIRCPRLTDPASQSCATRVQSKASSPLQGPSLTSRPKGCLMLLSYTSLELKGKGNDPAVYLAACKHQRGSSQVSSAT